MPNNIAIVKHTSIPSALLHGITAFIKHYGFKSGWRYGGDGFTIAVSNALGSYKYIKLNERNQALSVSLINALVIAPMP